MNKLLACQVLEEIGSAGVKDVCLCPGARNAPLVELLTLSTYFKTFYWYEERSAAFFALGKCKIDGRPTAVITTSGTAVAELLPAAMEAYYSGNPLILITADRPRRFRGTGAPQCAEQVGIFGIYATYCQDLENNELCSLAPWNKSTPAHINICFEDPC